MFASADRSGMPKMFHCLASHKVSKQQTSPDNKTNSRRGVVLRLATISDRLTRQTKNWIERTLYKGKKSKQIPLNIARIIRESLFVNIFLAHFSVVHTRNFQGPSRRRAQQHSGSDSFALVKRAFPLILFQDEKNTPQPISVRNLFPKPLSTQ